jgi:hypothetical protein
MTRHRHLVSFCQNKENEYCACPVTGSLLQDLYFKHLSMETEPEFAVVNESWHKRCYGSTSYQH